MDEWTAAARERVAMNMVRYGLTPQQRRVAWCLFDAQTNAEIAERLFIQPDTAKNHVYELGIRLGARSRYGVILRLLGLEGLSTMQPQPGDELFVERNPDGSLREVFRRSRSGNLADITGAVGRVDSSNESFTIYGKRDPGATVEPWSATADRDVEATDSMLRGVVRFTNAAGWAL